MARNARTRSLRLVAPGQPALPGPIDVDIPGESAAPQRNIQDGVERIENTDGSLTLDFNPQTSAAPDLNTGFYTNLALTISDTELDRIASDVLAGIDRDDMSRREWLDTRARGITLLGLKLDEPRGDVGTSSVPLEGMSTVRHPLLLESVLRFHANARGELLPAAGPVKVRNDAPVKPAQPAPPPIPPQMPPNAGPPMPPQMGHNGGPPLNAPVGRPPMGGSPPIPPIGPTGATPPQAPQPMPMPPPPPIGGGIPMPVGLMNAAPGQGLTNDNEELASALETDMNHYLTATATEYYPDTDRMLFWVGAGGQGIKKVYNCPLRRRPVSESVDAEDIIVSNATTNLENCGRITQRIKMRMSVLRRMQIIGAYRDVPLESAPMPPQPNVVDKAKAEIQGVSPQPQKPEETDQEIFETYCELNIEGHEHKIRGKVTGLHLPYKVTIHKSSRKVLELRRNWVEGDKLCMPKQYFVDFPFVRAMGFYAIGLIHIVGNTTNALTAAWREMLDAGMFASFPGFIYSKQVGRQLTNQFRVAPGGGVGLDIGTGKLSDNVMPLPYKEPGAAFTGFIDKIQEYGRQVAGSAQIDIGEGNQEVPVGTTMAMIEQATKVMDAVHKRLHAAQAMEFKLLKERFKDDPEAFWRHNKNPTIPWRKEQFLTAIENSDLVPVADPNNPTSLHRIAKATAIKVLQQSNPSIYNAIAVDKRIMRIVGIDSEGLFNENPTPPPPDPRALAVQQKAQAQQQQAQVQQADLQIKAANAQQTMANQAQERQSRERIEQMKLEMEKLRLQQEAIIHAHDAMMEQRRTQSEIQANQARNASDIASEHAKNMHDIAAGHVRHQMDMAHEQQKHEQSLEHNRALNEQKVEAAKAQAKAVPKPKKPKKSES